MATQISPKKSNDKSKSLVYFFIGLIFFLLALLLFTRSIHAITYAISPGDPYADAVTSSSGPVIQDQNNSLGTPDQKTTGQFGLNSSLTLDMGSGEEGLKSLRVYFGPTSVAANVQVTFLDVNNKELRSSTMSISAGPESTRTFLFDSSIDGGKYRYVKITSLSNTGISIDGVQAIDYVGSAAVNTANIASSNSKPSHTSVSLFGYTTKSEFWLWALFITLLAGASASFWLSYKSARRHLNKKLMQ